MMDSLGKYSDTESKKSKTTHWELYCGLSSVTCINYNDHCVTQSVVH